MTLDKQNKIIYQNNFIYLDRSQFKIVWKNVFLFLFLHYYHFKAIIGIFKLDPDFAKCSPIFILFSIYSGIGVTAGAHRLWSHRSYSARLPLRIFLMIGHTVAGQNNLIVWCRDHRVHHKYSDTDADPHNINRGFFFSHMGWLMYKKHPEVTNKGKKIDLNDLKNDPVVNFQKKYYNWLFILFNVFIPIYASISLFGSSFYGAFLYSFFLRYATTLHSTWFVNSAAHMFGYKPYNEKIRAVENIYVTFFAAGEGYHNYHHCFPWDYAASEYGDFNLAKKFIDLMAKKNQAYNLKTASNSLVKIAKINVTKNKLLE